MPYAAAIGAAAQLGSSFMSSVFAARSASENRILNLDQADRERIAQREFQQQGLRWRVADARAAGLHPLAALGANIGSYSPVWNVGDSGPDYWRANLYKDMGNIGQDLTRAIAAKMNHQERELIEIRLEQERERLKGLRLDNEKVSRDINATPAMPLAGESPLAKRFGIAGQDDAAVSNYSASTPVVDVPKQRTVSSRLGIEAGPGPLEQELVDEHGHLVSTFTQPASEPMESSWYDQGKYFIRKLVNHAKGYVHFGMFDTDAARNFRDWLREHRPAAEPGYEFRYNPYWGNWVLRKKDNQYDYRLFDVAKDGFHFGWERHNFGGSK